MRVIADQWTIAYRITTLFDSTSRSFISRLPALGSGIWAVICVCLQMSDPADKFASMNAQDLGAKSTPCPSGEQDPVPNAEQIYMRDSVARSTSWYPAPVHGAVPLLLEARNMLSKPFSVAHLLQTALCPRSIDESSLIAPRWKPVEFPAQSIRTRLGVP